MANWKKVVVSGSAPELANLQVDGLTADQVVIGGGSAGNLSTTAINGTGNIVATTNLESTLNLIQIAMSLGFENVEYEPEAFPGLVYRMDDPKVVLLLFGSGKMVCVGAREVNNIKDAVRNIKEELSTAGLMRT